MSKGLTIWIDNGANVHSYIKDFYTWADIGVEDEQEWNDCSEDQKEELVREIAFQHLEWGWYEGEK